MLFDLYSHVFSLSSPLLFFPTKEGRLFGNSLNSSFIPFHSTPGSSLKPWPNPWPSTCKRATAWRLALSDSSSFAQLACHQVLFPPCVFSSVSRRSWRHLKVKCLLSGSGSHKQIFATCDVTKHVIAFKQTSHTLKGRAGSSWWIIKPCVYSTFWRHGSAFHLGFNHRCQTFSSKQSGGCSCALLLRSFNLLILSMQAICHYIIVPDRLSRCRGPSASPTVSTRLSSRSCCPSCRTSPSATWKSQRKLAASTWALAISSRSERHMQKQETCLIWLAKGCLMET